MPNPLLLPVANAIAEVPVSLSHQSIRPQIITLARLSVASGKCPVTFGLSAGERCHIECHIECRFQQLKM